MFHFYQILTRLCLFGMVLAALGGPVHGEVYEETGKKHSWFSFNKPAKSNPAEQLAHARKLLKDEKLKKAGKAFKALVTTWPSSKEAPAAQWANAKIQEKRGKTTAAFDAYQILMEDYPGQFPDYDAVLTRQFEIANEVMVTKKGKFFILPGFESPERAIPMFEKIIQNGPRSPHAAEAQYLIGEAYEKSFQYELAVVAYIATLHRYPLSPFAEKAAFGRARALYSITRDYPNDQQALDEAWAGVTVFLRAYPNSDYADEAKTMRTQLLDQKAAVLYNTADFYDRIAKRPQAAKELYEQLVKQFPNSNMAKTAQERIVVLADVKETPKNQDTDEQ